MKPDDVTDGPLLVRDSDDEWWRLVEINNGVVTGNWLVGSRNLDWLEIMHRQTRKPEQWEVDYIHEKGGGVYLHVRDGKKVY